MLTPRKRAVALSARVALLEPTGPYRALTGPEHIVYRETLTFVNSGGVSP